MPAKGPRLGQKAQVERGDYQCHSHRGTQTVTQIKASSRLTLSHSRQVSSGVQMTRQVHKEVPPHCLPAAPSPRLRAADRVRRFKLQPGRQSVNYNSVAGHVGLPETNASAGFAHERNEQQVGFISPPPTVAKRGEKKKPKIWAARSQASAHELIMWQHDAA